MKPELKASLLRAKERAAAHLSEDTIIFPIFSDIHVSAADTEPVEDMVTALKFVTTELDCEAVVNLGDNYTMLGRMYHTSNEEITEIGCVLLDKINAACACPVIQVNGNHDGIATDFFKADFWNNIAKSRNHPAAKYPSEGVSYYYIDVRDSTRLVILSLPSDSDLEAEHPTPLWRYGKAQLDWLAQTALDTERSVIILTHVPMYYKYEGDMETSIGTWNGNHATTSMIFALYGEVGDIDEVLPILDSFRERGGKLAGCFSGHQHYGVFMGPGEKIDGEGTNPLFCHQVVTTSCMKSPDFDLVLWTPSKKEITVIGVGSEKEITFKA